MTSVDNLSLERVTHALLLRVIGITLRKGHSMIIRGGVGIGKTYSVLQFAIQEAARLNRKLLIWIDLDNETRRRLAHDEEFRKGHYVLALFDTLNKLPEDTCGIPMPNNGFVEWKPPLLFWMFSQPGAAGVLFLDEFLQAQQMVQKPLADVFLNKQISDMRLQPEVGVIAASNEKHDKCGTIEMLEHAKNRIGHFVLLPPDARGWVDWAKSKDILDEDGNIEWTHIDPRIIMMIMSCPDQLYQPVGNRSTDAYPTPRSWTILSDLIRDVDHEKDKEIFLILVASRVGNGAAAKFQDVLNHDMSTHGPEIVKNPELFRTSPWDRKVAFTMWLSGHSKGDKKFLKGACKFLDLLGSDNMLDTMLYMMKATVGPAFIRELTGTMNYPTARDALVDMAKAVGSLSE